MEELKLPQPCVVVLVGPSGTGKTTWAHKHFDRSEVVSSDALRGMVGIDEDDQIASSAAFEILERVVTARLERQLTTVIDTTGLDRESRLSWIGLAREANLPIHAILFTSTYDDVAPLHLDKPRPIPQNVLKRQFSNMKRTVQEIGDEGFDAVHEERPVRAVTSALSAPAPEEAPETGYTFGLLLSRFDWADGDLGEQLTRIALRAEDAGFTDIWFMDHFRQIPVVGREWEDIPEAYVALSHVAAVTQRIRLGVLVSGITHRNPVVLGKMVATLDVLSAGRAVCGLGAAWDDKEHAAYGIDFPPLAHRYDLLEDTLQMLPLLWGKGSPSFEGKTFSAENLICYPRPIQDPIPIMVGGSGEKRTLRLVAEYADAANIFGTPEVAKEKVGVLERHCADFDRDPREVVVTNLVNTLVGVDRKSLRERIHELRGRNQTVEQYAERHNAGTVDDLVGLFNTYSDVGVDHSIVSLPDVSLDGSLETFGAVIAAFK